MGGAHVKTGLSPQDATRIARHRAAVSSGDIKEGRPVLAAKSTRRGFLLHTRVGF
jgi:hypothetical protein